MSAAHLILLSVVYYNIWNIEIKLMSLNIYVLINGYFNIK
jgi:hypothetical protein